MSTAPLQLVPRLTGTTGQRIQSARGFHRWSQDQILAIMGELDPELVPSRKTYSGWENDHKSPTVAEIRLIAHATRFPIEDFVNEIEDDDNGPDDPSEQVSSSFPWDTDSNVVPLRLSQRAA